METGKTAKYFKYAIGEIILVVIGILIALQINNWNEIRKNNKKHIDYQRSLINDINKDIESIDNILISFEESIEQHNNFTKRLSQPNASYDTLVKIAKYEFLGYFNNIDAFHTATFQTLLSTGDIGLFNENIRTQLIELNNQQQITLVVTKEAVDQYLDALVSYKYLSNISISTIKSGNLYDEFWNNVDKNELVKDFYLVTLRHNNINRTSKTAYIKLRKDLIKILNNFKEKE
ncbi:hypothetical protein IU405_12275 [Polaribacter sp. BAL334]|uniref:DUF6090 family protein n=1 Tax=Polaribacter sp. BAL334 TaxID=1708178 RepID=UPI0018D20912|nr:DUF6090 family protein [Polaribacter sp. BAL334]MBG7613024.1 hypothetical protein [Polaribacter sp. BAL334]